MGLKKIRMEAARTRANPEGDANTGYEFIAPLTEDGHLDADGWRRAKEDCIVHRFARGEPDMHGHLVHVGQGWHFRYDPRHPEDDEALFKLDKHTISEGDYISVVEDPEEQPIPFRIVSIKDIAGNRH